MYKESMEAAGATVKCFKNFGDDQGSWWAFVEYNGTKGWVNGSFGSCSGCDAFEAEFGDTTHKHGNDEWYNPIYNGFKPRCDKCKEVQQKFIQFGKGYLENILTIKQALNEVSKNSDWDGDANKMADYICKESMKSVGGTNNLPVLMGIHKLLDEKIAQVFKNEDRI